MFARFRSSQILNMTKNRKKIPLSARRVFKGVIFDVFQWQQKMFDGSFAPFEILKRQDTVNVIAVIKNKIILLNQQQPGEPAFLSLPGGRVDPGETPLQAAKRELLEETGYRAKYWKLFKSTKPYNKIIWTIYTFIARDCKSIQPPNPDAGEKIIPKLISFNQFLKLADEPNYRDSEIKETLLRAKYEPKIRRQLHQKLFNN